MLGVSIINCREEIWGHMGIETQNKMLDLLGQAYQMVDDFDKVDALMEDIDRYLFDGDAESGKARNLPDYAGFDPHLEAHIGRIKTMIDKQNLHQDSGLTLQNHAQLIIAADGHILMANSRAHDLLSGQVKGYLNDLPLGIDGLASIRELTKELAAGVQDLERIIYLRIEADVPRGAFGYCRAIPLGDDKVGLHISLSYFEWTEAIIENLKNALGLSQSESRILQGVLKGQTRAEIAEQRGRSLSTVKAQANAILQKANCSNMNELAHLCTSIAYVVGLSDNSSEALKSTVTIATPRQSMRTLEVGQGRELAYYEYGDPKGQPVLFIHGFYQGPFFTDEMKREFLQNGLRIIAPSRPHFGYTSPPIKRQKYIDAVNDDLASLVKHLNLGDNIIIAAHHSGGSFAFRFAKSIEQNIAGMVLIGAGIPITNEHIKYMNPEARMASVASRQAPSIMRLLITLIVKSFRKQGMDAMLDKSYAQMTKIEVDKHYLHDQNSRPILANGMQHLVQQGAEAFVFDGRAQMLDWNAEYDAVHCPQAWIMARHCPLMGAHFVEDYVTTKTNHSVDIIEDSGFNVLFQSFDLFMNKIQNFRP